MRQWGLLGILGAFSAQAAVIEFELTDLGGGKCQKILQRVMEKASNHVANRRRDIILPH